MRRPVGRLGVGALALLMVVPAIAAPRIRKAKTGLAEILAHMNDAAKHLRTVSADLDYTTVTALVNESDTETGKFYLRNPKSPDILINFEKPDPKVILFRRNRAEIYYPKANRVETHDLQQQSGLVQQFLLLGFGTDAGNLKASYDVTLTGEDDLDNQTTVLLELVPKQPQVASQLTKIQIWVSEDSWLPAQQKFFQSGGDYLVAHYKDVKVNRNLPNSTFEINVPQGAERVKKG
jgi:outer membrane lipoprotein-sorting protein